MSETTEDESSKLVDAEKFEKAIRTTIKEIQKTRQKIVNSVKKIPKQFTDSISREKIDELLLERQSIKQQLQTSQQRVTMCYFREASFDLADDTNKNINKHKRSVPHFQHIRKNKNRMESAESTNITSTQNEDIKDDTEKNKSLIGQDKWS